MPKLGVFSGIDICSILRGHGFVHVRTKGSHATMQLWTPNGTITVSVPLHDEIKKGTLLSIIKKTQLLRSYFEK